MFEMSVIIFCLIINAVLAGSEAAFIAINIPTLRYLARKGDSKVGLLLKLRENPERTLSVIQVGITFVGAFAAAIGGAGAEESLTPWLINSFNISHNAAEAIAILLVVIPLTFASVVFGELVPKAFALRRSLSIAAFTAPWLNLAGGLINPIVSLFEWSTKKIIGLFPKEQTKPEEYDSPIVLEEVFSPLNKQYIMNMVKIERTAVSEILLDWKDVISIDRSYTAEEVEKVMITSMHTRLPVTDHENVIGLLNTKEFLAFLKTGSKQWQQLIRPTVNVQDSLLILSALRLLQKGRTHLGVVFNRNQRVGIVTMETIFEEIIGDIYDEDDDGAIKKMLASTRYFGSQKS